MFSIRDAEIIRDVARHGGFRAAASAQRLSQSAISGRVAALEARLGVQLFDRSNRRARLTAAGRLFVEEGERLIAARDRIAGEFVHPGTGTIRLGASETVVHGSLPAMLGRLRTSAPGLRIELAVETSDELAAMLAREALDAAILLAPFVPPAARSRPVGRFDLDWYAAAGMKLGPEPVTARALAAHALVTFSRVSMPYREVEAMFTHHEGLAPVIHGSASLATVLAFVERGMGIGTLPRAIAAAPEAAGRIVRVRVEEGLVPSPLDYALAWTGGPSDIAGKLLGEPK